MVDQSELAWRLLSRRHGAHLCYTPMFHSACFAQDPKYRAQALQSCPEDRPLVLQFCGNDPKTLLEASLLAQDHCDAIDINLGCPQAIARRGHYGSFLQDEWELLAEIVKTLHENLSVPVTCKIRRFDDVQKTIDYAKMLTAAGAQLLTVHGRTRDMKGHLTGIADWSYIKAVRDNVDVPVFANGNIMSVEDIHRCMDETGAHGVMTAEGNLHNPALFEYVLPVTWSLAIEYLDLVEEYPCPTSYIRGHLFKLLHHLLGIPCNVGERERIAKGHTVTEFRAVVDVLRERFEPYHEGQALYVPEPVDGGDENDQNLSLPPWICQPYIRMEPTEHIALLAEKKRIAEDPAHEKQDYFDSDGQQISRKRMKKLRRVSRKPNAGNNLRTKGERRPLLMCTKQNCMNPKGHKCNYEYCKMCCRAVCYDGGKECAGHGFLMSKKVSGQKRKIEEIENEANDVETATVGQAS